MNQLLMTTSWDDGHPLDLRVADLLDKFGFKGTFYVPLNNREGRPVLSAETLRSISNKFEIGGHTRDHVYLDMVSLEQASKQIAEGKHELEDCLGREIGGFAYPGGRYNDGLKGSVSKQGYLYARTTENFRQDTGTDQFALPTTLQFFPHSRPVYIRNFAKHGRFRRRFGIFATTLAASDLPSRLRNALDLACRQGRVFHLWGHSWELDEIDGWTILENFRLFP